MKLDGKVVVVTGAARGIGHACAARFAAEGASVVIADLDAEAGRSAAAALASAGRGTLFVRADVSKAEDVRSLIAEAVARFGRIDVMLNNAGIIMTGDILDVSEADFDRVLAVNLKSAFLCGQAAARQMVAQGGGGSIINMSSVTALLAVANQVAYAVSKAGVKQLTAVMAVGLAQHGIRVNAIGPGSIDTNMAGTSGLGDDEGRRRILARTPLGRLGRPAEIAGVAAFLASDDSSYITGQTLYADGGRLVLNHLVAGAAAVS